jgi:hypothetical protein
VTDGLTTEQLAERVSVRLRRRSMLWWIAVAVVLAALVALRPLVWAPLVAPTPLARALLLLVELLIAAGLGAIVGRVFGSHGNRLAARAIEDAVPVSHNLLFTALELRARNDPTHQMVRRQADALAATVDVAQVVPLRSSWRRLALAGGLWLLAVAAGQLTPTGTGARQLQRAVAAIRGTAAVTRVDALNPPPTHGAPYATSAIHRVSRHSKGAASAIASRRRRTRCASRRSTDRWCFRDR